MYEQQFQNATNHVQYYFGDKPCPTCANLQGWFVFDKVVMAPVLLHGGAWTAGPGFIVASCPSCGHTVFFNAAIAGAM